MSERSVSMRVKFYFSESDQDREARLARARNVIDRYALSPIYEASRVMRNQVEEVTLVFDVLAATALLHHAFESKLNKNYIDGGCGAGIVEWVE